MPMMRTFTLHALAATLGAMIIIITPVLAADPAFNQAVADYNARKYGQAASEFESLKKTNPSDGLTRYYLGLCRQSLGQYDKAKQEYEWVVTKGDSRLQGLAEQGLRRLGAASAGSSRAAGKIRKIYDFSATWCGPCKKFAPIFESTKSKFSDVSFESVDVDRNPTLADKYSVNAIPHLVFLDAGGKILYSGGAFQDEESFAAAIKKFH